MGLINIDAARTIYERMSDWERDRLKSTLELDDDETLTFDDWMSYLSNFLVKSNVQWDLGLDVDELLESDVGVNRSRHWFILDELALSAEPAELDDIMKHTTNLNDMTAMLLETYYDIPVIEYGSPMKELLKDKTDADCINVLKKAHFLVFEDPDSFLDKARELGYEVNDADLDILNDLMSSDPAPESDFNQGW